MTEARTSETSESRDDDVFADGLVRGDVVLGSAGPMLGMLLANHDNALFCDETVARVRGMVASVARQLLAAQADAAGAGEAGGYIAHREAKLTDVLARHLPLLGHCHALALEHRLALRLERRSAIDPVLSPMLQALVADREAQTAATAMALLAAQARFVQQQRRMDLPLKDLPRGLLGEISALWGQEAVADDFEAVQGAIEVLEQAHGGAPSRIELLAEVVAVGGSEIRSALALGHAGVALFLTALADRSGLSRELAALATNESQIERLVLMLRAAGTKPAAIAEQFLLVHPEVALPEQTAGLRAERARELLAASTRKALG